MRIALALVALATLAHSAEPGDCPAERKRARALREVLASVGETTAEYRAMLVKRIQEAETAAASCQRAAAEEARAAEAQRAAKKLADEVAAKKEAADRFAIDEMKSQTTFIRVAWSAYECSYEKQRDAGLDNPFATPEQKEALKRAEILLSRIRSAMKRGRLAPLSCRADEVAKLAFCIADNGANAACGQSEMALLVRAEKEIVASGQLAPNPAPLTPAEQRAKSEEDDMHILTPNL